MDALATLPGGGSAGTISIRPASRLRGELRVPGDKSVSHRALMLALVAGGETTIAGASDGADIRSTAGIVSALGASVERLREDERTVDYRVVAPGIDHFPQPDEVLDCGNSGTSLRLFAGILAGADVTAILDGDASLRGRPVARIIEPLRAMGATLRARDQDSFPPVTVTGRRPLRSIDWTTPVPSAQVKSAILLAGLRADGVTRVREAVPTRDHTERMLRARGAAVRSGLDGEGGNVVEIEGGATLRATDERVPGDPSAAAFWLVAGAIHRDAELTVPGVGVNPTRRAVIDLLRRMGADIQEHANEEAAGDADVGEPIADLRARTSDLEAIDLGPADVAGAIDEIPILALAATQARGRSTFRGLGELRHKESDRVEGIATGLRALGALVEVDGEDLAIEGPTPLVGAPVDSLGDHRLAMTFAIAGLIGSGSTTVGRPDSASISYPGFYSELERIRS